MEIRHFQDDLFQGPLSKTSGHRTTRFVQRNGRAKIPSKGEIPANGSFFDFEELDRAEIEKQYISAMSCWIARRRLDNVIQAPLTSLVKNDDAYFVFVKNESQIDARQVQIGSNNDKFIVIKQGLKVGEQVLVDADNYKTNFEFPPIGQP